MLRRAPVVVVVLALVALAATPMTLARFVDTHTSTAGYTADVLAPPTALVATGGTGGIRLTWTATLDTYAAGYRVYRSATSGSGFGQIALVTPQTAITTLDVPATGTWYYVLRSTFQSWTSVPTAQVSAIRAATPTVIPCAAGSNGAADGGDGDGYQTSPNNACASGGGAAVDANSGVAGRSSDCADPDNDRHAWWGYAFGLPATVTSIDGIAVRADASLNNNGQDDYLCVELSWDGGTSWTAAQRIQMPDSTLRTYTFGGPTATWGRTWAVSELTATAFRVRVTSATSHPNKTYDLDYLAAQVYFTP
jgi:hypothetical protein